MKRDMDLVRKILMAYEADDTAAPIEGYTQDQIAYHKRIMCDVGLLEPVYHPSTSFMADIPVDIRMTWVGHDFLDAARDDNRWNKAKGIMKQIGGATFDILKQVLTQVMADQVKQIMGG